MRFRCSRWKAHVPPKRPIFLYLLRHQSTPIFKIGVATDVWDRIRQLPDRIDTENSKHFLFRNPDLAPRLEKLLHTIFVDHARPREHCKDGYTEWYDVAALPSVLEFIDLNRDILGCGLPEGLPKRESRPRKFGQWDK